MRIGSAMIGMESARRYSSAKHTVSFIGVTQTKITKSKNELEDQSKTGDDSYQSVKDSMEQFRQQLNATGTKRVNVREQSASLNHIRQQCIQFLIQLFMRDDNRITPITDTDTSAVIPDTAKTETETAADALVNLGVVKEKTYALHTGVYYSESENTSFSTTGKVVTTDGREIEFGLEMQMSRSFQSYYETNYDVLKVRTCDPLVINLEGSIAELSDQKFLFDLDADGKKENISMPEGGSAYLALDKNSDGIINDGSELFGTGSGDGFADLAAYDEDGNGWIDEADSIYSRLKIWSKDENGSDILYRLADKGVGAICLTKAPTDFALTDREDNAVNGYIRSTGVFLYEDGRAGSIQHVDVAK